MSLFTKNHVYALINDLAAQLNDEMIMALSICHIDNNLMQISFDNDNNILNVNIDGTDYKIHKQTFLEFISEEDFNSIFNIAETSNQKQNINNLDDIPDELKPKEFSKPVVHEKTMEEIEAEEKERERKEFRAFVTETEQPNEEQLIFMDNDLDENEDNCEEEIPDDLTGDEIEEIIENQKDLEPEIPSFSKYDIDKDMQQLNSNIEDNHDDDETVNGVIPFKEQYPYIEQTSVHASDCVYKLFRASIRHKGSPMTDELFFYIYPLTLKKNDPSTEIVAYCYYRGQNITVSSFDGQNNLVRLKAGEYEFLIRGTFVDGKFDATINTTGNSATTEDQLTIAQTFINNINSGTIDSQNGHIKFKYVGWESDPNKLYEGIIEIFPTDFKTDSFLIVRRIEDYIDYFYTDKVELGDKKIYIQTKDEMQELVCWWDNNVIRYELILAS